MGPQALLPLRRKACYGFLSPLKIHHPRPDLNRRTFDPMASRLTIRSTRATTQKVKVNLTFRQRYSSGWVGQKSVCTWYQRENSSLCRDSSPSSTRKRGRWKKSKVPCLRLTHNAWGCLQASLGKILKAPGTNKGAKQRGEVTTDRFPLTISFLHYHSIPPASQHSTIIHVHIFVRNENLVKTLCVHKSGRNLPKLFST
jgi:hypothetical protein